MKDSVVFLLQYYRNSFRVSDVIESGIFPGTILIESRNGQPYRRSSNLPQFYKQVAHHI